MKRLMLSGALLLSAATSCTSAKAGYYAAGASRYAPSTVAVTNHPLTGSGAGYSYEVQSGVMTGSNRSVDAAMVDVDRGGYYDFDASYTRTGALWIRSFNWVATAPTDVRPTNATYTHAFTLQGDLTVRCPTPADANTNPVAVANVTFYAEGVNAAGQGLYDGGRNELRARKDGSVVDRLGQPATSPRSIYNDITFYKQATNVPATGDQSVEVRIECQALADGRLIPGGTSAFAASGNQPPRNFIYSSNFVWNH